MSANHNITWDIVCASQDKPWSYKWLCYNPNITIEHTLQDYRLQQGSTALNPNITWDIVRCNPHIKWSYGQLSRNPNITWDIVCANPNAEWDYSELMLRPGLTWDQLITIAPCEWNVYWLIYYRTITMEIFEANLEFFTELLENDCTYYAPHVRYPNI